MGISGKYERNRYIVAIVVAIISFAGAMVINMLNLPVTELVFLPVVLVVGYWWGFTPSLVVSLISVWGYAIFFSPLLTHPEQVTTPMIIHFGEVLAISLVVGTLASKARHSILEGRRREQIRSAVVRLSHEVAVVSGIISLTRTIVMTLRHILGVDVVLLIPQGERLEPVARSSDALQLSQSEIDMATWVWHNGRVAGRGTSTMEEQTNMLFHPLLSAGNIIGVLGIGYDLDGEDGGLTMVDSSRDSLLEAVTVTIAAAIEREMFAKSAAEANILRRHEEFYTALLSSISHDFRTPLSTIIGAAETLSLPGAVFTKEIRDDMLAMIREEAQRLNRFVSNLLDMTKLQAGRLNLNFERAHIEDVIGTALSRSERQLKNRNVTVEIDPAIPMVQFDFVLIEHVLTNLLENAVKYSDDASPIRIEAKPIGRSVAIRVIDRGKGIPAEDLDRVFEKFYRVQQGDVRSAGTGLGLSICRGIVEAHGGKIYAQSPLNDGKGTMITVSLPVSRVPESLMEAIPEGSASNNSSE